MNKLTRLIKAIGLIIRKPYLLNKILDDNDAWQARVQKDYGIGDGLYEASFHDLSKGKEISVKPFAFMEGGSIPTDLALLRNLAAGIDDCKYFEIGTWRGESVANVAEVASECTTMNLPADRMLELGLTEDYIQQHAMYSKNLPNVIHLQGNSLEFNFPELDRKYDLIFIDGDHHYESIKKDTENVFAHLMHEKSIVVWHDYAWQPGNVRFETLAAIYAGVPKEYRAKLYAVRHTLCAIYHPGGLNVQKPSKIAKLEETFGISISTEI